LEFYGKFFFRNMYRTITVPERCNGTCSVLQLRLRKFPYRVHFMLAIKEGPRHEYSYSYRQHTLTVVLSHSARTSALVIQRHRFRDSACGTWFNRMLWLEKSIGTYIPIFNVCRFAPSLPNLTR
jgi:hypothetical protein